MNLFVGVVCFLIELMAFTFCAWSVVKTIPSNVEGARWKKVTAWVLYAMFSVMLPWFQNDIFTILVLMVWYLLMARLLYFKSKAGVVCQIIYLAIMLATQFMGIYLALQMILVFQIDQSLSPCLVSVLKAVLLVVGTLILRGIMHRRYVGDQKFVKVRGMILVPVFSMILMFLYVLSGDLFFLRFGYYWLAVFCVLLLIINVYCLYFWYEVAKNGELKHRLKLVQQQNELTLQYYEEMEKNYNRSRKIIHDIRNHLNAIEQAYKVQDSEYIHDVHGMLNSLGMKFYTDHKMLNIVLNDKLKVLPADDVDCNLGGIRLSFISDMDITTIFANLLDNAVETLEGEEKGWMKIRGEQIQDFTVIKISNPCRNAYTARKSTKENHQGIGLENVRQALEKYHGEIKIEQENQVFSVTLVFPGREQ